MESHFADATATLEDELALTIGDPFLSSEKRWITIGEWIRWAGCSS
jgi:hypothetical protein